LSNEDDQDSEISEIQEDSQELSNEDDQDSEIENEADKDFIDDSSQDFLKSDKK
jgi:hypothetical protein